MVVIIIIIIVIVITDLYSAFSSEDTEALKNCENSGCAALTVV